MRSLLVASLCLITVLTSQSFATQEKGYGGQTMVGELKKIMIRKPDESFGNADPIKWHYTAKPHLANALQEHKQIEDILRKEGVEIIYHDAKLEDKADSIFVHDPAIMTDAGAIILRMGKPLRRGEEKAIRDKFKDLDIPILWELQGDATAEGGDILWIDKNTLVIGRGFRTNQKGIDQIRSALKPHGVSVLQFDLPYDQGKEACLHLQSLISLIDHKTAIIYRKLAPVSFVELLEKKGFKLIDLPEDEYVSMGTNVLAIKPNICLALGGNPKTKLALENAGCKVYTYKGTELSYKAEGGPTCLTRPVLRQL